MLDPARVITALLADAMTVASSKVPVLTVIAFALVQLPVDAAIYALRYMVERCFNKLKNARRLATRYDKTADSYLGFVHIVSIRLWMRQFVNASWEPERNTSTAP